MKLSKTIKRCMTNSGSFIPFLGILVTTNLQAEPIDCTFKGKSIGEDVTAYVRNGTVTCTDPDTKKMARQVEVKSGKIINEKRYVDGVILSDISQDGSSDNKTHGWAKEYENGKLSKETLYDHGNEKLEKVYFPNGKIKSQRATYEKDPNQKSRVEFDEKGLLVSLECSPAIIDDKQKEWCGFGAKPSLVQIYSHGNVFETLSYDKGQIMSQKQEGQDGVVQKMKVAAKGSELGVEIEYFPNGKKKSETRVNSKGETDGIQRLYFEDSGNLGCEEKYEKGKKKEERCFYENGKTRDVVKYIKRVENRFYVEFESFHDNGQKESAGTAYLQAHQTWAGAYDYYHTFERDGQVKNWDRNGVLTETAEYKEGEKQGWTERFVVSGGKQVCQRRVLYEKGDPIKVEVLKNKMGKWVLVNKGEFFSDGSIKTKGSRSLSQLLYDDCEGEN